MSWEIRQGDALERLREMPDESVQTVVTSPPYWGLRSYGGGDQEMGTEVTPEQYVANLVEVFREVRRVLRKDGTVWCNLGDSYATQRNDSDWLGGKGGDAARVKKGWHGGPDLKSKDLCGIPWRVAFALQADGWWLRSDIIWSKPNPMPESVTDRPTRAHEYLFLLTKSARYFYDADAIREQAEATPQNRFTPISEMPSGKARVAAGGHNPTSMGGAATKRDKQRETAASAASVGASSGRRMAGFNDRWDEKEADGDNPLGRNKRSVWTVATQPYPDAHFATFPPKLVEPCILAGSPPKCCGECGAPWERVTERERRHANGDEPSPTWANDGMVRMTATGRRNDVETTIRTLGWRPTCECHFVVDDEPFTLKEGRSVVLDPFCGSGTTGVVALRHDRSFIGIELNEDYCELARNRIRDDAPLLNTQLEAA